MSLCDFCKCETKYSFVCPICGNHFCNDHRKPENHNCSQIQAFLEVSEEKKIDTKPVLDSEIRDKLSENRDQSTENDEIENNEIEESGPQTPDGNISESNTDQTSQSAQKRSVKVLYGFMIVATILSIALMGSLVYSNQYGKNLQQRYDTLLEYFSELKSSNQELILQADNRSQQLESLQIELDKMNLEYSDLQNNWDALFSDNAAYRTPSIDELISWLATDTTDRHNLSSSYTPLDQSILLSLKAKTQNLRLGVIIIRGTLSNEPIEYVYNIAETDTGAFVYISPQADEIWYKTEEIIPNKSWNQGEYNLVIVTEVLTIIEP